MFGQENWPVSHFYFNLTSARDISNKCHFYLNRIRKQRYFEQNWLHFAIWRSCAGADGRFANSVEFADKGILMPLNWVIIIININTTNPTKTMKTTTTKQGYPASTKHWTASSSTLFKRQQQCRNWKPMLMLRKILAKLELVAVDSRFFCTNQKVSPILALLYQPSINRIHIKTISSLFGRVFNMRLCVELLFLVA